MRPDYDRIPAMLADGMVVKQIAHEFGVHIDTIRKVARKRGFEVSRPRLRSIKAVLASGPALTREIADRTGASPRAIAVRLNQLANQGVVERAEWVRSRNGFSCVWKLCESVSP